MNKQRRSELAKLMDRIEALREQVSNLSSESESIRDELEDLREQEQEAFDNMPEGLQQGERGQDMEEAISCIDIAAQAMGELFDTLEAFDIDATLGNIDDARGQA